MRALKTDLPEVLLIETKPVQDNRGFFWEIYQEEKFAALGIKSKFVQDNLTQSKNGVLRGLHFQQPFAQGKLIQVIRGEIFDVAVDIRRGSPNFGKWVGLLASEIKGNMIWIPEGFAHGFVVLSDLADVIYKVTSFWAPDSEHVIRWDDPTIGIDWPVSQPILAEKDANATSLDMAKVLPLYRQ